MQVHKDTAEIYALCCPSSGAVRYIGKANNSQKRLGTHLRDSNRRNTPLYAWIRGLAANGRRPVLRVLCSTPDWQEEERRLIAAHKSSGKLLNVAAGGNEPFCPCEVRAANGKAVAVALHSDPQRKAVWALKRSLAQSIKDGYVSETTKQKIRLAARSKPEVFGRLADLLSKVEASRGAYA
jgi:hypothetical protein